MSSEKIKRFERLTGGDVNGKWQAPKTINEVYTDAGIDLPDDKKVNNILKTGKGIFLFIEVPSDIINIYENMGYLIFKSPNYETWIKDKDLWNYEKCMKHLEKNKDKDEWKQQAIKLPDGNYKFIAVLKSFVVDWHEASQNITELTASQIVDDNGDGCWDNYRLKKDEKYTCTTAMDSFKCLLLHQQHSLKADSNYAILKKE